MRLVGHMHGTALVLCADPECWAAVSPAAAEKIVLYDPEDRTALVARRHAIASADGERLYLAWTLEQ